MNDVESALEEVLINSSVLKDAERKGVGNFVCK